MKDIEIPKLDFHTARLLHQSLGREEKFIASEHMCRHPFVKDILHIRQHGLCAHCEKYIVDKSSAVVHHKTYDIYCQFLSPKNPEVRVKNFQHNGNTFSTVPNCELCYYSKEHNECSERCLNNLALVCSQECHDNVHGK